MRIKIFTYLNGVVQNKRNSLGLPARENGTLRYIHSIHVYGVVNTCIGKQELRSLIKKILENQCRKWIGRKAKLILRYKLRHQAKHYHVT